MHALALILTTLLAAPLKGRADDGWYPLSKVSVAR